MKLNSRTQLPASALSLVVSTLLAGLAPGQEVLVRIEGAMALDAFGRADEIGDLDGDGVPDLVHLEDREYVVFRSGADGSVIVAMPPNFDYRGARTKVKGIGDFDGDGIPDALVGAPGFDVINGLGRVDLISGATTQVVMTFVGTQIDANLGTSVTDVGDVDGDGYTDVLFSDRFNTAFLHYGPDGARVREHSEYADEGAVAVLGDVDGDGYPDYGVGSPNFLVNGLGNAGAFYVFSGQDGTLLHQIVGDVSSGFLGRAAGPAGDLNDDGYDDYLIGLARDLARVYSGFDGAVLWEYSPPGALDEGFGNGIAGGKDFTGDGVCDWVVGAQFAKNTDGDQTGAFYMFDGASGALIWKVYGADKGFGHVGKHVFLTEDMNGDGLAEIGYGDVSADISGLNSAGVLTVIAGAPGGASTYCMTHINSIGRRAKIAREGPVSVGNNEFTLKVSDAVPDSFGLFYYGTQVVQVPFGDGIRCVGGMTQRLFPPIAVDGAGTVDRILDFTQPPVAPGGASPIDPGATRYFQFWYRDSMGPGGTGFNLSNAMEILFTP